MKFWGASVSYLFHFARWIEATKQSAVHFEAGSKSSKIAVGCGLLENTPFRSI
jgi:hypothetical protein